MPESIEVSYCGLFCGDCIIRNGELGARSSKLLRSVITPDFAKLAKGLPQVKPAIFESLKDYPVLINMLTTMTHLDCEKICKEDGGSSDCRIRECCRDKGYDGCWDCNDHLHCETLAWLDPVHCGANIRNIETIRNNGMEEFLSGAKYW